MNTDTTQTSEDLIARLREELAASTKINDISRDNLKNARDAIALIRAAVEQHVVGALPSVEQLQDPSFTTEAEQIVTAIAALAEVKP